MVILTGVGAHLCAAHRDIAGRLHGHSYEVVAWFPAGSDAVALQCMLQAVIAHFDHTELLQELTRAEALAEAIAKLLPNCLQVDISRPLERLFAKWIKK